MLYNLDFKFIAESARTLISSIILAAIIYYFRIYNKWQ